jgi:hypothetical protein
VLPAVFDELGPAGVLVPLSWATELEEPPPQAARVGRRTRAATEAASRVCTRPRIGGEW